MAFLSLRCGRPLCLDSAVVPSACSPWNEDRLAHGPPPLPQSINENALMPHAHDSVLYARSVSWLSLAGPGLSSLTLVARTRLIALSTLIALLDVVTDIRRCLDKASSELWGTQCLHRPLSRSLSSAFARPCTRRRCPARRRRCQTSSSSSRLSRTSSRGKGGSLQTWRHTCSMSLLRTRITTRLRARCRSAQWATSIAGRSSRRTTIRSTVLRRHGSPV